MKKIKNMIKNITTSPGGSDIIEYESADSGYSAPGEIGLYAEEITSHMEALFPGRLTMVHHEILSNMVHIDINVMYPTEENKFYVLYTTGMSDLPMNLPEGLKERKDLERAELIVFLPSSYNFGDEYTMAKDIPPEHSWPLNMLQYFARFPHLYNTWLGWGHTIPNGPDYEPICPESQMGGTVLLELNEEMTPVTMKDGTVIHIYYMLPLYKEEIEYKLEYGMDALNKLLIENELQLVIDIKRKNYCK